MELHSQKPITGLHPRQKNEMNELKKLITAV